MQFGVVNSEEHWLDVLRDLRCQDGRFSLQNLHNYQHAASYPAFIVSGNVSHMKQLELTHHSCMTGLPHGCNQKPCSVTIESLL